ncbi:MAG: hypothetical protein J6J83_08085 [Oscillospiraceae bacterium]|nr:hypothetical protein [Oscillospiraceae bacterium]
MLSKPVYGWSDFQLDDTSKYELSYLDDIAFDWLNQAIHGLETMLPFCVKGFLEPNRFLCVVSYWNCHIICEEDECYPIEKDDVQNEVSHTSMLQFCRYLYDDISQNKDEWIYFPPDEDMDTAKREKELTQKLIRLRELISEREEWFGEGHCFL